jgi:hypothetical protein
MSENKQQRATFLLGVGSFLVNFVMLVVFIWHERDHDHTDYTGPAMIAGLLLLSLILTTVAVIRNWKDANRERYLRGEIVTIKDDAKLQIQALEKRLAEALREARATPIPTQLKIHSAVYGPTRKFDPTGTGGRDVTETLQKLVRGGLIVEVQNNTFGFDPSNGRPKRLRVTYSYGNQTQITVERREHDLMVLPEDSYLKEQGGASLFTPLQGDLIQLSRGVKSLMDQVGPMPVFVARADTVDADHFKYKRDLGGWASKAEANYKLRFSEKVEHTRLRINAMRINRSDRAEAYLLALKTIPGRGIEV